MDSCVVCRNGFNNRTKVISACLDVTCGCNFHEQCILRYIRDTTAANPVHFPYCPGCFWEFDGLVAVGSGNNYNLAIEDATDEEGMFRIHHYLLDFLRSLFDHILVSGFVRLPYDSMI